MTTKKQNKEVSTDLFTNTETIEKTQFSGQREQTDQWDIYTTPEAKTWIATDRVVAHQRIIGTIPYKGVILAQAAAFFAELAADICPVDFITAPHQRVLLRRNAVEFAVSFRVHGFITNENGRKPNMWDQYKNGVKNYFGNNLPAGLKENQKLETPIIVPIVNKNITTRETIFAEGLVDEILFEEAEEICLKLFSQGTTHAAKQGLILASAKYEFGIANNELVLMTGLHTLDSATYWKTEAYETAFATDLPQKTVQETVVAEWLASVGFTGNGPAPPIPEEIKVKAAEELLELTEQLLGEKIELKEEMNDVEEIKKAIMN
ncbi:hypothetical protein HZA99_06915 [Candidatus Woesearchaeota archaeon]|nr:hypothetical protein [Candidatus Woesearchaeota archaeon]